MTIDTPPKAVVERDLEQGFISKERMRFTIEARKKVAPELAEQGYSTRDIAAITGASKSQIANDLNASKNGQNASKNGQTTRELLSQSDQNDWRTPGWDISRRQT